MVTAWLAETAWLMFSVALGIIFGIAIGGAMSLQFPEFSGPMGLFSGIAIATAFYITDYFPGEE